MVELEEVTDEPSVSETADARVQVPDVDESLSAAAFRDVPTTLETESGSVVDCNSRSDSVASGNQGEARSVEPDRTTTALPEEERFEDALSEEDQIKVREGRCM